MNEKKKLQLNQDLVVSLEEMKELLGGNDNGNGYQGPEDLLGCPNCDGLCQITCAYYTHMDIH